MTISVENIKAASGGERKNIYSKVVIAAGFTIGSAALAIGGMKMFEFYENAINSNSTQANATEEVHAHNIGTHHHSTISENHVDMRQAEGSHFEHADVHEGKQPLDFDILTNDPAKNQEILKSLLEVDPNLSENDPALIKKIVEIRKDFEAYLNDHNIDVNQYTNYTNRISNITGNVGMPQEELPKGAENVTDVGVTSITQPHQVEVPSVSLTGNEVSNDPALHHSDMPSVGDISVAHDHQEPLPHVELHTDDNVAVPNGGGEGLAVETPISAGGGGSVLSTKLFNISFVAEISTKLQLLNGNIAKI